MKDLVSIFALSLLGCGVLWAAPPVVKTVPWIASNPLIPHDTWSGKTITLKGTSDSQGPNIQYTWDFGDGSPVTGGVVTNRYAVQATHGYTGATNTLFIARLTVTNANTGESASKPYYVIIRDKILPYEVNVAIDEGLWYLHKDMRRFNAGGLDKGDWTAGQAGGFASSSYFACSFANLNAFEVSGHLEGGDPENPYTETVQRGMRRLFEILAPISLPLNPSNHGLAAARGANPDSSTPPNGFGIYVNQTDPWTQTGMAMDALVASGRRDNVASTGSANIIGRKYSDIVQDMVDAYAWAQYDFTGGGGSGGGGWRYTANTFPDNFISQWAAFGILAAERQFGCTVPPWLKPWNQVWLNFSAGTGGNLGTFGYTGPNQLPYGPYASTPAGLVQLAMDGIGRGTPLWDNAETYLRNRFGNSGNAANAIKSNYFGLYSFTKAMLLHDSNGNGIPDDGLGGEPSHIVILRSQTLGIGPLDWYAAETSKGDPTNGVARTLVNDQTDGGYWFGHHNVSIEQSRFETAWAIIMLSEPGLIIDYDGPPFALAKANPNPAVAGQTISLDGSDSFHSEPARKIVKWEWDLDNNGNFDVMGPFASVSFPALGNYPVKLRVTDDAAPPKAAENTVIVRIATPPLVPTADAGGPYVFCPTVAKWFLNATRSTNPDDGLSEPGKPGDRIIEYAWDLNGDNSFNDAFGPAPDVTAFFRGNGVGSYVVQVRVTDNTAASFPSSGQPNLTSVASSVVVVEASCVCVDNLAARPKATKIQLTWAHQAGTDHYNVYRGSVSGGPYTLAGDTFSTFCTWTDNNVQTGMTYYYVVRPADALDQELCQSNETSATPARRTISPTNIAPVASAGPAQRVLIGQLTTLDGSRSSDSDGDPLTFSWSFVSRPAGSTATLFSTTAVRPSFSPDKPGDYIIQLIVNDGMSNSLPSFVTISTGNEPPIANAGPNQSVAVGRLVTLDGSGSSDLDGNPLTYNWSFVSRPTGSNATLSNPAAVNPTFTVDEAGIYELKLVVSNGFFDSAPDFVTVSTVNSAGQNP